MRWVVLDLATWVTAGLLLAVTVVSALTGSWLETGAGLAGYAAVHQLGRSVVHPQAVAWAEAQPEEDG